LFEETTSPKFIRRNWFVLCWSAKWLGKKRIYHSSLPDFRGYKELPSKTEKNIDRKVMKGLWDKLDECDIAVAHNLKSFDRKKANTRFIINGMPPPSPYEMVDTLQIARSEFKFTSNKLGYISSKLSVSKKIETGGFDLWVGCENGDKKSWDKMIKYCDQDVKVLEDVYLEERPYMRHHPNLGIILNYEACPKCGSKEKTRDGIRYTLTGTFQKFRCKGCKGVIKQKMSKKESIKLLKKQTH